MIKAVVFDLDDTLISEKEYVLSGFKKVSKVMEERYKLNSNIIYEKMMEFFKVSSKNVFNKVLEYFDIKYSDEDILTLINVYRNHNPNISFYDDVIPTINYLKEKGIKLGIITDGYKETQHKKIEALGCEELFEEIIITDELGKKFWKPNKKAYKIMAEKLNVKFNEMIYVGDNEQKDFIGANELGIITIMIERVDSIYVKDIQNEVDKIAKFKINKLDNLRLIF